MKQPRCHCLRLCASVRVCRGGRSGLARRAGLGSARIRRDEEVRGECGDRAAAVRVSYRPRPVAFLLHSTPVAFFRLAIPFRCFALSCVAETRLRLPVAASPTRSLTRSRRRWFCGRALASCLARSQRLDAMFAVLYCTCPPHLVRSLPHSVASRLESPVSILTLFSRSSFPPQLLSPRIDFFVLVSRDSSCEALCHPGCRRRAVSCCTPEPGLRNDGKKKRRAEAAARNDAGDDWRRRCLHVLGTSSSFLALRTRPPSTRDAHTRSSPPGCSL